MHNCTCKGCRCLGQELPQLSNSEQKKKLFVISYGQTRQDSDFSILINIRHELDVNKKKVKCSRYRPGVAQRVGRGIALLFHDRGTRRGWVVSKTPRPNFTPEKNPVHILQEAGWASGPVWTGGKSRPHRHTIPDRPARSSVAIPAELPGPLVRPYYFITNQPVVFIKMKYKRSMQSNTTV